MMKFPKTMKFPKKKMKSKSSPKVKLKAQIHPSYSTVIKKFWPPSHPQEYVGHPHHPRGRGRQFRPPQPIIKDLLVLQHQLQFLV